MSGVARERRLGSGASLGMIWDLLGRVAKEEENRRRCCWLDGRREEATSDKPWQAKLCLGVWLLGGRDLDRDLGSEFGVRRNLRQLFNGTFQNGFPFQEVRALSVKIPIHIFHGLD